MPDAIEWKVREMGAVCFYYIMYSDQITKHI